MSEHVGDEGDPTTIQTLLGDNYSCQREFRSEDRERIISARAILEYSYADLIEFVDGDINEDPYFIVESNNEETIRIETYTAYKLVHHYLAALYSYNEAVRSTVTAYLPTDIELTKKHFDPVNGRKTEYTRRLMYLRGLRVAAQHGAFNDCLPVRQWDTSSNRYRIDSIAPDLASITVCESQGNIFDTRIKTDSMNRSRTLGRFIQRILIRSILIASPGSIRIEE